MLHVVHHLQGDKLQSVLIHDDNILSVHVNIIIHVLLLWNKYQILTLGTVWKHSKLQIVKKHTFSLFPSTTHIPNVFFSHTQNKRKPHQP